MNNNFENMSTILLEAHGASIKTQVEGPRPACLASLTCIFNVLIERGVFTPSELISSVLISAIYNAPQNEARDIVAQVLRELREHGNK